MNNKDQDRYIHISKLSRKKRRFSKISSRLSLIVGENKHVTLLARRDLIVQRPAENILYRPVKISLISRGKLQPLSRWNRAGHASRARIDPIWSMHLTHANPQLHRVFSKREVESFYFYPRSPSYFAYLARGRKFYQKIIIWIIIKGWRFFVYFSLKLGDKSVIII